MKANRKFVEGDEGVSAVIGVILMVAITVAIAATVYVYVSGMMGGTTARTPSIAFTKDEAENTLTVVSADPGLDWADVNITVVNSGDDDYASMSGIVVAGNVIDFDTAVNVTGDIVINFRYDPTNSLIGTYKLTAVV